MIINCPESSLGYMKCLIWGSELEILKCAIFHLWKLFMVKSRNQCWRLWFGFYFLIHSWGDVWKLIHMHMVTGDPFTCAPHAPAWKTLKTLYFPPRHLNDTWGSDYFHNFGHKPPWGGVISDKLALQTLKKLKRLETKMLPFWTFEKKTIP